MAKYKNPALSRVDGVLTAHCCICGKRLGDEYSESFYKLIRQKYCPDCAAKVEKENGVFRQGEFKKRRKRTYKEVRSILDVYRKDIEVQKQYISELQRELDDLKRRISC
ncbi:MAG TPA: hypothetical protein P5092_21385 [Ruminococcus sp.]|jgi:hypothetical protein|nr:hypothetical protein [Ruminococcus sp.]